MQYADRTLECFIDPDGMWNIKAKLTPEQGELIRKLLYGIADGYLPGEEDTEAEQRTFPRKRSCHQTLMLKPASRNGWVTR